MTIVSQYITHELASQEQLTDQPFHGKPPHLFVIILPQRLKVVTPGETSFHSKTWLVAQILPVITGSVTSTL